MDIKPHPTGFGIIDKYNSTSALIGYPYSNHRDQIKGIVGMQSTKVPYFSEWNIIWLPKYITFRAGPLPVLRLRDSIPPTYINFCTCPYNTVCFMRVTEHARLN